MDKSVHAQLSQAFRRFDRAIAYGRAQQGLSYDEVLCNLLKRQFDELVFKYYGIHLFDEFSK
jgi:hypothetical protein